MTRAAAREIAVQLCFAQSGEADNVDAALDNFFDREYYETLNSETEGFAEYPNGKQRAYIRDIVAGVAAHQEEIDGCIERFSRGWKLSRISRTALAVLRVAVYEILYVSDVPCGVAISEAVELAKGYDVPETVAFINGVLGGFARSLEETQTDAAAENAAQETEEPAAEAAAVTEE